VKAQKAVDILRRTRHDFLNHLQVITGYIELGKLEDVKDYITCIVEEMVAQRTVFEFLDAETALYLYEQMFLAHDLGIVLRYKDLKIKSSFVLTNNNEPYNTLKSLAEVVGDGEDEALMYLSLYEENEGEIDMVVSCAQLGEKTLEFKIKE